MTTSTTGPDVDAVVVGAGFSGLYALHRLRELGLSVQGYEKAPDVGGTWYWNRYPGARCDSESHIYCYSFDERLLEEWEWSERYPEQPEILAYLRHVADRLDLRPEIAFETEVRGATYDGETATWTVRTDDGTVSARFLVSAVGCLSEPYRPDFDGLGTFEGEWHHTARWPAEGVGLEGRRIGVVGTGSTGIQTIPELAGEAAHLTVFQRTPNYAVPAQNRPLDDERLREIAADYDAIWERARHSSLGMPFDNAYETADGLSDAELESVLEKRWQQGGFRFALTFEDLLTNPETNERVAEFIRGKIREAVDDPDLAEKLVPTDHPYGAKRPPMNYGGYYETFNREDVSLVDVRESPVERVTPDGIRTAGGHHDLDLIVFATGFDAMTGALLAMDIEGREGTLSEAWTDGPRTYLGLGIHGYPNLFTVTGPQSPSVLSNMPVSIEHHVEWIADCIAYMREHGYRVVEPTAAAVEEWVAHTNEVAEMSLYSEADSWYRGANVPGKPRTFTPYAGGVGVYRERCTAVAENGYEGFEMRPGPGATVDR